MRILHWGGGLSKLEEVLKITKQPLYESTDPVDLLLVHGLIDQPLLRKPGDRADFFARESTARAEYADQLHEKDLVDLVEDKEYISWVAEQEESALEHYKDAMRQVKKGMKVAAPNLKILYIPGKNDTRQIYKVFKKDDILDGRSIVIDGVKILGLPSLDNPSCDVAYDLRITPTLIDDAMHYMDLFAANKDADIVVSDVVSGFADPEVTGNETGSNRIPVSALRKFIVDEWAPNVASDKSKIALTAARSKDLNGIVSKLQGKRTDGTDYSHAIASAGTLHQENQTRASMIDYDVNAGVVHYRAMGLNGQRLTLKPHVVIDNTPENTNPATRTRLSPITEVPRKPTTVTPVAASEEQPEVFLPPQPESEIEPSPPGTVVPDVKHGAPVHYRALIREKVIVVEGVIPGDAAPAPDATPAPVAPKKRQRKTVDKDVVYAFEAKADAADDTPFVPFSKTFKPKTKLEREVYAAWCAVEKNYFATMHVDKQEALANIRDALIGEDAPKNRYERVLGVLDGLKSNASSLSGKVLTAAKNFVELYATSAKKMAKSEKKEEREAYTLLSSFAENTRVYLGLFKMANAAEGQLNAEKGALDDEVRAFVTMYPEMRELYRDGVKVYDTEPGKKDTPFYWKQAHDMLKTYVQEHPESPFMPIVDPAMDIIAKDLNGWYYNQFTDGNLGAAAHVLSWGTLANDRESRARTNYVKKSIAAQKTA